MARPKIYQKIFSNNGLSNEFKHDALPAQDKLPSQSGQSGKYLGTDGTNTSWNAVDALPSQEGQSGKFLTTDGTAASWDNVPEYSVATQSADGLMSSTDKTKLDGVESGAQVNAVTSVNGQTGAVSLTIPATPSSYISSKGSSGNLWYIKFSDGLIIQGGCQSYTRGSPDNYSATISFPLAFSGTLYDVSYHQNGSGQDGNYAHGISSKSTSSCIVRDSSFNGVSTPTISWTAFGY